MSTSRLRIKPFSKTRADSSGSLIFMRLFWLVLAGASLTIALVVHKLSPFDLQLFCAVFASTTACAILTVLHLKHYPVKGVDNKASERIFWITSLFAIIGVQIARKLLSAQSGVSMETSPLLVSPIIIQALLVSALLGPAKGVLSISLTSICLLLVGLAQPWEIVAVFIASWVGCHAVNPLPLRSGLFRAAMITAGSYAVTTLALAGMSVLSLQEIWMAVGWAFLGGFVSSAVFWFATVPLEKMFQVVSDASLLELFNPEQPLLRELMLRAPGTYAHSVMVGNLAEQAAQAIGANPLLCRAMAYYHDIGKIQRPTFFIENKMGENPHEKLTPSLSAQIISAHVKDGLKMAEAHKLPKPIQDGIAEHHGTSLISYFYHKFTQSTETDPILEQHFRYPGPRPRSKESAILMLGDRVEAATRTLTNLSPGRLRSFVWEIVHDVREDGQLDDSDLNFRDLETIVDAFVSALTALKHERIDYPGVTIEGIEEGASYINLESDEGASTDIVNKKSTEDNVGI